MVIYDILSLTDSTLLNAKLILRCAKESCPEVVNNIPIFIKKKGDYHKGDEIGGTCGTHGGRERCLQGFSWEVRRE
jgi:hypothetical protein